MRVVVGLIGTKESITASHQWIMVMGFLEQLGFMMICASKHCFIYFKMTG